MSIQAENTKRIAKNTMMLYIRMMFSMVVSLFTTRIVLDILGVEDYGIYNLVAGVVGMMNIVTGLLSQGSSRFITIALGKGDAAGLKNTFSACLTIHLALAFLILNAGEAIGPQFISSLNIAPDRLSAARFTFHFALLTAVLNLAYIPFNATIIAHERMNIYAYIAIWESTAKLLVVYLLLVINIDKLKLFSLLYFIIGGITAAMYYLYCRKHFAECRNLSLKPDFKLYKEIFSYIGWNTIGVCAFTMNTQGMTILLNIFGTAVNAARGIATTASGAIYNFANNFMVASRPQIVKLCAVGNYKEMNSLVDRTSKFASYLIGFIGIPLFIEMDYVLGLWLKEVPEYTVVFTRLTLIQGLVQAIDTPIGIGIHAVGKMKLPNLTSAFIYMIALPISYLAIKSGASPEAVYIVIICTYPVALFMDLYILNRYTGFPVIPFLLKVVRTVFFVIATAAFTGRLVQHLMDPNILRLCFTVVISCIIFLPTIYFFGMDSVEKRFIKDIIIKKLESFKQNP